MLAPEIAIAHEEAAKLDVSFDAFTLSERVATSTFLKFQTKALAAVRFDVRRRLRQKIKRSRVEHRGEAWWSGVADRGSFFEVGTRLIFDCCFDAAGQALAHEVLFDGLSLRDYQLREMAAGRIRSTVRAEYRFVKERLREGMS